jgi:hypothetical protein
MHLLDQIRPIFIDEYVPGHSHFHQICDRLFDPICSCHVRLCAVDRLQKCAGGQACGEPNRPHSRGSIHHPLRKEQPKCQINYGNGLDRGVWRIDAVLGYRFTRHLRMKLQYSFSAQQGTLQQGQQLVAAPLALKF